MYCTYSVCLPGPTSRIETIDDRDDISTIETIDYRDDISTIETIDDRDDPSHPYFSLGSLVVW